MMIKQIFLVGCLALLAAPANASIDLSVTPVSQTVALGSQTSVDINISGLGNGTALGTYDITLDFDATLLSYSATIFGDQLDLFGLGDIQTATPGNGNVEVFELSLESESDLNSLQATNFRLATLTFDTLAAGINSPLTLSINALGDASGNTITASVQNSTVSVSAVPTPSAVWFFGSAIGLLGLNRQRKK